MTLPNFSLLWSGPENLFWLLTGLFTAQAWQWVKAKFKDWRHPEDRPHSFAVFNSFWVIAIIGVATMLWVVQMNTQNRMCQIEFNQVLTRQSELNAIDTRLTKQQNKLTADWVHDLILPPKPYDQMDPQSPQRTMWAVTRTLDAWNLVNASIQEQDRNERIRAEHPTPNPKCGTSS